MIIQGGSQYGLGAAIHVTGGGLLNAVNSDFLNGDNNQHPGGSVAVANNANFSCTGCRFVGNSGRNGGAIYCEDLDACPGRSNPPSPNHLFRA